MKETFFEDNSLLTAKELDFYKLVRKMFVPAEFAKMQEDGFFMGDVDKDLAIISKILPFGADDAQDSLAFLGKILDSRHQAIIRLSQAHPELSFNELVNQVEAGKIEDPYPLKRIEDGFLTSTQIGKSITSHPTERQTVPEWWSQFSSDFRRAVGSQFKITHGSHEGQMLSEI